jgi:hypothetical protein
VPIAGVVESPTSGPAQFAGITTYVTMDTMEWLSGERDVAVDKLLLAAYTSAV